MKIKSWRRRKKDDKEGAKEEAPEPAIVLTLTRRTLTPMAAPNINSVPQIPAQQPAGQPQDIEPLVDFYEGDKNFLVVKYSVATMEQGVEYGIPTDEDVVDKFYERVGEYPDAVRLCWNGYEIIKDITDVEEKEKEEALAEFNALVNANGKELLWHETVENTNYRYHYRAVGKTVYAIFRIIQRETIIIFIKRKEKQGEKEKYEIKLNILKMENFWENRIFKFHTTMYGGEDIIPGKGSPEQRERQEEGGGRRSSEKGSGKNPRRTLREFFSDASESRNKAETVRQKGGNNEIAHREDNDISIKEDDMYIREYKYKYLKLKLSENDRMCREMKRAEGIAWAIQLHYGNPILVSKIIKDAEFWEQYGAKMIKARLRYVEKKIQKGEEVKKIKIQCGHGIVVFESEPKFDVQRGKRITTKIKRTIKNKGASPGAKPIDLILKLYRISKEVAEEEMQ